VRAKQAADLHTSTTTQLLALEVLRDQAFLEPHVAALRSLYARRCDALVAALRAALRDAIELDVPDGGFFLWTRLPGVDTTALLPHALAEGVAFVPGSAFGTDADDRARLSFASLDTEDLTEAAVRLARAVTRSATVPIPA
jgi:2-aminoadipate transaminase